MGNGETLPNTEVLKLLSKLFQVSINTLLGCPRKLVCQCCGMPLEDDASVSREPDGTLNEEYCKWCYNQGQFAYSSMEELTSFLVEHMSNEKLAQGAARAYFEAQLPPTGPLAEAVKILQTGEYTKDPPKAGLFCCVCLGGRKRIGLGSPFA